MWLANLSIPGQQGTWSIRIRDGKIAALVPAGDPVPGLDDEPHLSFNGEFLFPGLINSHDHLDFNLFPAFGNQLYNNYRTWGPSIQAQNADEIQAVLKVPLPLRLQWGIYKNLLNGFTTVVNHGERLPTGDAPITVHQEGHSLHSVGFERNWRWKLNRPLRPREDDSPFVLHVGEGTDTLAHREITRLIRWNLFKRPLIGVHGVAMDERQAAGFRALVWCPASNYFLLGKTAPIGRLKTKVPILFGTDSTLTAPWDAWNQIRLARQETAMTDDELLQTLTAAPAAAWGLPDRGRLARGLRADLVISRPTPGPNDWDRFYATTPSDILLVLSGGKVVLFDPSLSKILNRSDLGREEFRQAGPYGKYVIGDVYSIMKEIRSYYPGVRFPDLSRQVTPGYDIPLNR